MKQLFYSFAAVMLLVTAETSFSSIRVATYNILSGSGNYNPNRLADKIAVIRAIEECSCNGITRPVDILVLQELMSGHVIESYLVNGSESVNGLNYYYGRGIYAWDAGPVGGDGYNWNGMIYNTQTVQLIERVNFRAPTAPRDTLRYRFRIIGYGPDSDIYLYNFHMKAYDDEASRKKRSSEAQYARWSIAYGSDSLPAGTNIIYAGDFNLTGGGTEDCTMSNGDVSSGGGYDNPWYYFVKQKYFTGSGAAYYSTGHGQAVDPAGITFPVNWNNSSSYRRLHTWNSVSPSSRLDFQLVSYSLYDGEGVSFIGPGVGNCIAAENSLRPLGNDGTHFYGGRIKDSASGRYAASVFNHLAASSDHLPVIADYQRPAVLAVDVAIPTNLVMLSSIIEAVVTVRNASNVSTPVGADELDYHIEIISGGTLVGNSTGVDYALSGGNSHQVLLDTSSPGPKFLEVRVTSDSQGCANAVYRQTFEYQVGWQFNCSFFEFTNAWLSQEGDMNWNPNCYLIESSDRRIDLKDFAVLAEHWLLQADASISAACNP